jgi:hypothetical protein
MNNYSLNFCTNCSSKKSPPQFADTSQPHSVTVPVGIELVYMACNNLIACSHLVPWQSPASHVDWMPTNWNSKFPQQARIKANRTAPIVLIYCTIYRRPHQILQRYICSIPHMLQIAKIHECGKFTPFPNLIQNSNTFFVFWTAVGRLTQNVSFKAATRPLSMMLPGALDVIVMPLTINRIIPATILTLTNKLNSPPCLYTSSRLLEEISITRSAHNWANAWILIAYPGN